MPLQTKTVPIGLIMGQSMNTTYIVDPDSVGDLFNDPVLIPFYVTDKLDLKSGRFVSVYQRTATADTMHSMQGS